METVPNTFPSLFTGYSVLWGLLSLYIVSLGIRVARLERGRKEDDRSKRS